MKTVKKGKIFCVLRKLNFGRGAAERGVHMKISQKRNFGGSLWRYAAGGSLTGAANGLFGGGGGMIAVPVLERAAGLPAQRAHATAIAVILPACIVSGIVYLLFGLVPFDIFLPVCIGVVAGGVAGARLLPNVSASSVTFLFAALMLAAGVKLVL